MEKDVNGCSIDVGMAVVVCRGGYNSGRSIEEIERLTKTQIITKSGSRFRKETLRAVGDHYGARIVKVATVGDVNEFKRQRALDMALFQLRKSTEGNSAKILEGIDDIIECACKVRELKNSKQG